MLFGIAIVGSDEAESPLQLAPMVEKAGFDSLFVPDHTHTPVRDSIPYPFGGELPRPYRRLLDPFVALTAAMAVTERLKLGFGICLAAQRDPLVTAKAIASLDHLSGGRVVFGVGAGWDRAEMRTHGVDPKLRFDRMREHVEAMRLIWAEEEASYRGDHVSFDPIWSWPKPVQRPGPPVLIGGQGPTVIDRILEFGDGWIPNGRLDPELLLPRIDELMARAEAVGKPRPQVTLSGAPRDLELIARYERAGVDRCVWWVPSRRGDEIAGRLEQMAQQADRYRSEFGEAGAAK